MVVCIIFYRSKYIARQPRCDDRNEQLLRREKYSLTKIELVGVMVLDDYGKNDLKEINVSHRHHMFKKGYFYDVTVSSLIPVIKVQRTGRDDELKHQDFRGARTQCSEIGGKCAI